MRDGGKGDAPRPLGIPMEEFDKKWDDIFNKKEDISSVDIDVEAEQGEVSVTVTKTWSF